MDWIKFITQECSIQEAIRDLKCTLACVLLAVILGAIGALLQQWDIFQVGFILMAFSWVATILDAQLKGDC